MNQPTSSEEAIGRPTTLVVRIAVAAAVVAVTTAVAVEVLPEWEKRLFEALNGGPGWLEWVLWVPMQFGSLFGPMIAAAGSWTAWGKWRPSVGSIVAGVVAWQAAKAIKAAVERGRPFDELEEFAELSGTPYEGLGFLSGHAALAFSVVAVLSPYLARWPRAGFYALACVVALARVQVSAHLPLDVVGGAALGYAIGNLWNLSVGVPVRRPDDGVVSAP